MSVEKEFKGIIGAELRESIRERHKSINKVTYEPEEEAADFRPQGIYGHVRIPFKECEYCHFNKNDIMHGKLCPGNPPVKQREIPKSFRFLAVGTKTIDEHGREVFRIQHQGTTTMPRKLFPDAKVGDKLHISIPRPQEVLL